MSFRDFPHFLTLSIPFASMGGWTAVYSGKGNTFNPKYWNELHLMYSWTFQIVHSNVWLNLDCFNRVTTYCKKYENQMATLLFSSVRHSIFWHNTLQTWVSCSEEQWWNVTAAKTIWLTYLDFVPKKRTIHQLWTETRPSKGDERLWLGNSACQWTGSCDWLTQLSGWKYFSCAGVLFA